MAVGSYGDHGYSEGGSERDDSGSVFMISLNSDFKGGEVKSRIGHGYTYNTGSDCYANSTCASFSQDFDTESETDLKLNRRDRLGWSVTLNHEGSLLAASRIFDDGKGNNATNAGAVNLFKFMKDGSVVSAETGTATYVGTIGYGYDYLDTSDNSEHTVTLGSQDVLGKSVAFDKDANRLAVSFNDKSSEGGTTKPGGVHLYNLTDNLASASYVATIGDGYSGGKNVDLSAYMDAKDLFGDGVDLNETGSRLVISGMLASGNSNTQSKSGEVMLIKFDDDAFSSGEIYGIVGSGYGASNLDIDDQLDDNDQFGRGISLDRDGDRMAVTSTLDAGPNPAND